MRYDSRRATPDAVLDLISALSNKIVMGASLDDALDFVFYEFDAVIPFDRIGFAEIDSFTQTVHARWLKSRSHTHLGAGYSAPLAGSSLEIVIKQGRPRILNDLPAYLEAHPNSRSTELIVKEGLRSSMTWPLFLHREPYAFLFFTSANANTYDEHHVSVLKAIGNQLALLLMTTNVHHPHDIPRVHQPKGTQLSHPSPGPRLAPGAETTRRTTTDEDTALAKMELQELMPGMVVGAPVMLQHGRVLVAAGVSLTERVIARILTLRAQGFLQADVVHVRTP